MSGFRVADDLVPLRVTDDILCGKQRSLYHSLLIASVAQLGSKVDKYIANELKIKSKHGLGMY